MRADRLLSLLLLLQTRGRLTAADLAGRLEVSQRTIYRDLDALSAAGIPVYAERGPGGGCALMDSYRTDLTGLTEGEVAALFMGGSPGPLADLGIGKALQAAWLKLVAALPPEQRRGAEHVQQRIHLDALGWFQPEEAVPYLGLLQEAVWQDHRLWMRYRRANATTLERVVEPYGLVAKASIWYMVAAARGDVHIYRVSRVLEAELTAEPFERPAGFDLAAFWAASYARFRDSLPRYTASLCVAPEGLALLLGDGAQTALAKAGPPDAEGRLTVDYTFDSPEAARGHVLSLGTLVEVLAPAELREAVRRQAADIAGFYEERDRRRGA